MDKVWLADEKGLREVEASAKAPEGTTLLYLHDDGNGLVGLYARVRKGGYRVRRVTVHSNDEYSPRVFVVTGEQASDVVFRSCSKNIAGAVAGTLNAVLGHKREGAGEAVKQLTWEFFEE